MRRDIPLLLAVCALCVVLLAITIVLYGRAVAYSEEIGVLRTELAEAVAFWNREKREG